MNLDRIIVYLAMSSHLLPIFSFGLKSRLGIFFLVGLLVDFVAFTLSKFGIPNLWLFMGYMLFELYVFTFVFKTTKLLRNILLVVSTVLFCTYPLDYFFNNPINYSPIIQIQSFLIVVYLGVFLFRHVFNNLDNNVSDLQIKIAMLFLYYQLFVAVVFSSNTRTLFIEQFSVVLYMILNALVLITRNIIAYRIGRKHKGVANPFRV